MLWMNWHTDEGVAPPQGAGGQTGSVYTIHLRHYIK